MTGPRVAAARSTGVNCRSRSARSALVAYSDVLWGSVAIADWRSGAAGAAAVDARSADTAAKLAYASLSNALSAELMSSFSAAASSKSAGPSESSLQAATPRATAIHAERHTLRND